MPYAEGRVIHDADAHIMEMPGFLAEHLEAKYRTQVSDLQLFPRRDGFHSRLEEAERAAGEGFDDSQIMLAKNWSALGSWRRQDRPRSIDLLGFSSQLMFTTALLNFSNVLESGQDHDLAYAVARAHTRHMVEFCSVDRRLLPTGYVPLLDFERTAETARVAIEAGAKALLIPSRCPDDHSPSHIGFDPLWAIAQEAGLPIVFHVGGGGLLLEKAWFDNGLPPVPDFHGGDDNFRSLDYMAIGFAPMKALTALIVDRVLDRFPKLRFGVIEQGASWVPGWMRNMDSAHNAFCKNEERLQKMSLKPSEFVKRQVRVTPYPHEDTGWIIANTGDEVCLFSSDYPHVEGGRHPIKRFEASMEKADVSAAQKQRFYCDNFVDLMGRGLS
ncbi:MAG: amidohydrolase family protein [Reyranella sp.]|uniref:amidohydrolase family protein n=1 Tax=Reyranella sp. TaxID=1929291 RepID=UPI001AC8B2AE|nr:amidohydrolase family protein [Reyranella sp.]MBN9089930.1 amidohydrolase family protein [Reyranella sp.]